MQRMSTATDYKVGYVWSQPRTVRDPFHQDKHGPCPSTVLLMEQTA